MSDRELIPMTSARAAAAKLDAFLADPRQAGTPFSYQEIVACEELGELPAGAVDLVRQFGFQEYLVPAALGGRFRSLEELYWVTRIVSQRNLTIAVMFGSALLGANPVWLWGAPEQKAQLAAELLDGRLICFAVSEADHGSDLLATETVARRDGAELALSGVKWPVGNATRARFVTTFARMGAQAKFSLLLVDKEKLDPGCWQNLPFVKTVGLRGHDLSGIAYEGARIPASAVIGQPGTGLVQTLKALQITRRRSVMSSATPSRCRWGRGTPRCASRWTTHRSAISTANRSTACRSSATTCSRATSTCSSPSAWSPRPPAASPWPRAG